MDNGFWIFLAVIVILSQIETVGNAFKEDCVPVIQEVDDGTE